MSIVLRLGNCPRATDLGERATRGHNVVYDPPSQKPHSFVSATVDTSEK